MMNKNEIVKYKNNVENLKNKLIWNAIKNKLPPYLESITNEIINKDIKRSLSSGYDFLCYYIDNNHKTYTNGFSIIECIKDYYKEYTKEFEDIDINIFLSHFKFTGKLMNKICNLDCIKIFVQKFLDNSLYTTIITSEENEEIKIRVCLLDNK